MEEASKAFSTLLNMKRKLDQLNKELETRTDYESDAYMNIINEVSDLGMKYYAIEEVNIGLKLRKHSKAWASPQPIYQRFSGGWRMRIELAKILLQNSTSSYSMSLPTTSILNRTLVGRFP
jgi:ATP-binding cassette subfamily F protein 3